MSKLEIEKLMRLMKQVFFSSVSTAFVHECSRHLISQRSEKSERSHIFQALLFIRGTLLENYVNQSHFARQSTFHYYTLAGTHSSKTFLSIVGANDVCGPITPGTWLT